MSRIVKVALVLAGFGLVSVGSASAHDHWRGGYGGGYGRAYHGGWGGGYSGGWGSGYGGGFSGQQFYYGGPVYHDTSHLHYYGPSYQRHGNHFHYVPPHTHIHRSGHWHR